MGITAEEHELLEFFGVEPEVPDAEWGGGWDYLGATYKVDVGEVHVEFGVNPYHSDVSLVVTRADQYLLNFVAHNVDDVRVIAEQQYEALEIRLGEHESLILRLRPRFECRQRWSAHLR